MGQRDWLKTGCEAEGEQVRDGPWGFVTWKGDVGKAGKTNQFRGVEIRHLALQSASYAFLKVLEHSGV